jgi:hypothetical protein
MTTSGPGRRARALSLTLLVGGLLAAAAGTLTAPGQEGPRKAAPSAGVPRPNLPRHYRHIRIAMLAYHGNPMGAFEDDLLKSSVDLVVPDLAYVKHIHDVAPRTPQVVYTNTSTLYLDLLTDWLAFADVHGVSREAAFYHAAVPEAYKGNSPSSRPVHWFWNVLRGGGKSFTNLTNAAHGPAGQVRFGGAGDSLYLGYPERYREINVALAAAGRGCQIVPEYCSGVDAAGRPAAWRTLALVADGTAGMAQSGQVTFDPPRDWRPASVNGSARLYYVRLRTAAAGTPPVAASLLGRDFTGSRGTTAGTVPVFDASADADHDGYLSDAEYNGRTAGKDARFFYESRMLTAWYGPMRFVTSPAHPAFRQWAAQRQQKLLAEQPLAAGLFMDNSGGKLYHKATDVVEPVAGFSRQYGALMAEIARSIAPRWILLNTEGGEEAADQVIRHNPAYLEEFALKPLAMHWPAFENLLGKIDRRSRLTNPPPLGVIDSHPDGGAPDDPRTLMATLAAYYLMADPDSTCLMFFGGAETGTTWRRHWAPAAAYDVGPPMARWTRFASGSDAASPGLSYRVYARSYEKALVLYRPLSGHPDRWSSKGGLGAATATRHELGATYRPLQADGTLGAPTTSITLRGGEGAVLVRIDP